MFDTSRSLTGLAAAATVVALALGAARPTGGAADEARYVVEPGDTLWLIAEEHYDGDPREAIWAIKERNGMRTSLLSPGTVLVLPR
ncbi:MAG: LysM peptidoglycan-binding domain-containing protein [Actinobacteria bacterium]|nr:LysM peptidoglycan-binding domain-containing protein [Actinomycetota bacterium]